MAFTFTNVRICWAEFAVRIESVSKTMAAFLRCVANQMFNIGSISTKVVAPSRFKAEIIWLNSTKNFSGLLSQLTGYIPH